MDNEQSASETAFENDFFDKIIKMFRKIHELKPLVIMQIMSDYRGNLNINFFYYSSFSLL